MKSVKEIEDKIKGLQDTVIFINSKTEQGEDLSGPELEYIVKLNNEIATLEWVIE